MKMIMNPHAVLLTLKTWKEGCNLLRGYVEYEGGFEEQTAKNRYRPSRTVEKVGILISDNDITQRYLQGVFLVLVVCFYKPVTRFEILTLLYFRHQLTGKQFVYIADYIKKRHFFKKMC